ncbi:hypothetical protein Bbelb_029770 [Branchiostoma belcheri]|nr:hypothetical protein Bbelb_029770 [Branchiostoma belcheri]
MGRKLRHVLIFLLIILKAESNMPEADCSCKPSLHCRCTSMGLTSIPQNLPSSISGLDVHSNLITTVDQSLLLSNCDHTGQGRSQPSTDSKTNTTAAVMASGDDQAGQAQSPRIVNMSRNKVLAALMPNPMYADMETAPKSAGIASSHDDQAGQDQSHDITESNTHTTCAAVASVAKRREGVDSICLVVPGLC